MCKLLTCLCLLLLPAVIHSAPVTLNEALRLGLQQSERHLSMRAQAEASRAEARLAASQQLPKLTLTENLVWTNEPGASLFISLNQQRLQLNPAAEFYNDPTAHTDFQSRLQLSQSLYDPNLRYGRLAAEKQAAAAGAMQEASAELLVLNVFSAYLEIQRSEAMLEWADASLAEARELLRLATEREQAGTGLKADRLNAEARVSESLKHQSGVQVQLQIAQLALALQLGQDEPLQIAKPLSLTEIPPPQAASGQRSELQALALQSRAAEIASQQAASSWQPRLQAGASWTLHDRDYPFADSAESWMVNADLTWVLFDGFGRKHASAKARAEERSLRNRHRQAVRQARFDQQRARLQTETLRQQVQASNAALTASEESYQLLLKRYRNGLTPLVELLTVQALLALSRAELADSKIKLILSLGQQHYLQGTLLATLLPGEDDP